MTWRDDLHIEGRGSFRGVEFFVRSADRSAGRRTVIHEFPGRDKPMVEDLGKAAGRVTLEAYVLGPDYFPQRNALYEAFNRSGPGPLIHPYWGSMTVTVVGQVRLRETTDEGGMARFTLSIVEGGEDVSPTIEPDTQEAVNVTADAANEAVAADLEEAWTVEGVIEAVRDAAQDLVDGVNGVTSILNQMNGYANAAMNQVDAVGDSIQALADGAAAIILLPSSMATTIQNLVQDVLSSIDTLGDAWDQYFTATESPNSTAGTPSTAPTGGTPATGSQRVETLMTAFRDGASYGDDYSTVTQSTPQRVAQAANQAAMVAYMRSVTIVETCRTVATLPLESAGQGAELFDELSAELDTLMDAADDDSYSTLVELRAALAAHLANASAELPRVITHTPIQALPALVIAHNLYGDSTRDVDIIDRNGVRNPAIVPGGVELEVLSDA